MNLSLASLKLEPEVREVTIDGCSQPPPYPLQTAGSRQWIGCEDSNDNVL